MKTVCVLPGDGIGPEVVGCAVRVLQAVSPDLELVHGDIGSDTFSRTGTALPDETLVLMRESDSALFGAVTSSQLPGYSSPVLMFRTELDLFANVRPVLDLTHREERGGIDFVIVRENSEGLYNQREEEDHQGVTTFRRVTRRASNRIVDFAIEYALRHGRRHICCVHKANVLRKSDGLFLSTFRERMSASSSGLAAWDQLVDSAGMLIVREPRKFDVIVTLNLYGDILSDVAAGVIGGLGFAPSGNIGPRHSVFEPAHGSAPDITGKGIANPTAAILSAAMMLDHLGIKDGGQEIRAAVRKTYASGHLTVDVGGRHGSESFTDHVIGTLNP